MTVTIYSSTSDQRSSSSGNVTYATEWDKLLSADSSTSSGLAGQQYAAGKYYCFQACFHFDTSGIPDDAIVTDVKLYVHGTTDSSTTDFIIQARAATYTTPLIRGSNLSGATLLATKATAGGFTTGAYNEFTSEAAFAAAINKTGTTYVNLSSSRQASATAPTGNEYVIFKMADVAETNQDPYIVVTYEPAATTFMQPKWMGVW